MSGKNPIIFASNAGTTGRKLGRVQLDEVVLLDTSIMTSLINIVKVQSQYSSSGRQLLVPLFNKIDSSPKGKRFA